ncbi:MAG: hypothetical protein AABZ30_11685 [Myxococcota bacterium]
MPRATGVHAALARAESEQGAAMRALAAAETLERRADAEIRVLAEKLAAPRPKADAVSAGALAEADGWAAEMRRRLARSDAELRAAQRTGAAARRAVEEALARRHAVERVLDRRDDEARRDERRRDQARADETSARKRG